MCQHRQWTNVQQDQRMLLLSLEYTMCSSGFFCLCPCTTRFPLAETTSVPWQTYSALKARQLWIQLQIDWLHKRTDGGERWLLICERYKTPAALWTKNFFTGMLSSHSAEQQQRKPPSSQKNECIGIGQKTEHKTYSPSGNKTATQNKEQQEPARPCSCQGANSGTTPEVPSILHASST